MYICVYFLMDFGIISKFQLYLKRAFTKISINNFNLEILKSTNKIYKFFRAGYNFKNNTIFSFDMSEMGCNYILLLEGYNFKFQIELLKGISL